MHHPPLPNCRQPHPDWIDPDLDLEGVDGNAFAVLAYVMRGLRAADNPEHVVAAYQEEATSGDYNHLLLVSMAYAGMVQ
jgi:hypothetical protein